jgi:hypothetical protein
MTKEQAIAKIINDLSKLDHEQAQSVLAYVEYLTGNKTFYELAPQSVRDEVALGIADLEAGRTVSHDELMARMDAKIAAART